MTNKKKIVFSSELDDETVIKNLECIIDEEYKKDDADMDMDLLDECFSYLEELNGKNPEIKAEKELDKFMSAVNSESAKIITPKRRLNVKIAIAAALAAILMASTALVVVAFDDIRASIEKLFSEKKDFTDANGDDYVYIGSGTKQYSSVHKLAEHENISILYPSVLPEGIEISKWNSYIYNDVKTIATLFSDPLAGYSFSIVNEIENIDSFISDGERIEINGLTVYAIQSKKGCHSRFIYDGNTYHLDTADREGLILILENLKELSCD